VKVLSNGEFSVRKKNKGNTWFEKGNSLYKAERYEEAIRCFEQVLKLDPRNASAWNNKGLSLSKLGRHEEAILFTLTCQVVISFVPGLKMGLAVPKTMGIPSSARNMSGILTVPSVFVMQPPDDPSPAAQSIQTLPRKKKLPTALEEVYIIIEAKLCQHRKKLVGL